LFHNAHDTLPARIFFTGPDILFHLESLHLM
jgi:hypothetical protein